MRRNPAAVFVQPKMGSIVIRMDIAEGAGELSRPEKARFYRIARRSAVEVVAWLDITRRRDEADRPTLDEAMALDEAIVAMLVRLIKATRS